MTYINQQIINDRAKLMTHRLIARRLARYPDLIERARDRQSFIRSLGNQHDCITEWDELLDLGATALRRLIISRSENMARLRISSPLGIASGMFTDEALRRRIRRMAKRGLVLRAARRASAETEALAGQQ